MGLRMTKITIIEFIVQQSTSALHLSTHTQQLAVCCEECVSPGDHKHTAARQSLPLKLMLGTVRAGGTV